jgi:chemotaxis protein MotB
MEINMSEEKNGNKKAVIVIKKIVKGGEEGGHGGSWKVAYADFMTAMMAFFLLMWLVTMSAPGKKQAVASYFKFYNIFDKSFTSLLDQGYGIDNPTKFISIPYTERQEEDDRIGLQASAIAQEEDGKGKGSVDDSGSGVGAGEEGGAVEKSDSGTGRGDPAASTDGKMIIIRNEGNGKPGEVVVRKVMSSGEAGSEALKEKLKMAIETKLVEFRNNVIVDITKTGVRVEITDSAGSAIFPLGSAVMNGNGKKILQTVCESIADLKNNIAIEGHTDALSYSTNKYTNWELSTERASAARKELQRNGINPDRIILVAGYAARHLLIKENPNDPRNRRISISIVNTK